MAVIALKHNQPIALLRSGRVNRSNECGNKESKESATHLSNGSFRWNRCGGRLCSAIGLDWASQSISGDETWVGD